MNYYFFLKSKKLEMIYLLNRFIARLPNANENQVELQALYDRILDASTKTLYVSVLINNRVEMASNEWLGTLLRVWIQMY